MFIITFFEYSKPYSAYRRASGKRRHAIPDIGPWILPPILRGETVMGEGLPYRSSLNDNIG
jgi:hypothetical protein